MSETKLRGTPVRLAGEFISVGKKAPHFALVKNDLSVFSLEECMDKFVVLNIFPSLDTDVCAASVRKFNELAASLPHTVVLAISRDLPFAQKRFCTVEGIKNVIPLSDFSTYSTFGKDYGVQMTDGPMNGLFARAVVVIGRHGKVIYTELVPEITREPNYEGAVHAIHSYSKMYMAER